MNYKFGKKIVNIHSNINYAYPIYNLGEINSFNRKRTKSVYESVKL